MADFVRIISRPTNQNRKNSTVADDDDDTCDDRFCKPVQRCTYPRWATTTIIRRSSLMLAFRICRQQGTFRSEESISARIQETHSSQACWMRRRLEETARRASRHVRKGSKASGRFSVVHHNACRCSLAASTIHSQELNCLHKPSEDPVLQASLARKIMMLVLALFGRSLQTLRLSCLWPGYQHGHHNIFCFTVHHPDQAPWLLGESRPWKRIVSRVYQG